MTEDERIEQIKFLAKVYGWNYTKTKNWLDELTFKKDGCTLTVWPSTMTVRTTLLHPKKGKTQLFRKRVQTALLERLFRDPRTHTRKGYQVKGWRNFDKWHTGRRSMPKNL